MGSVCCGQSEADKLKKHQEAAREILSMIKPGILQPAEIEGISKALKGHLLGKGQSYGEGAVDAIRQVLIDKSIPDKHKFYYLYFLKKIVDMNFPHINKYLAKSKLFTELGDLARHRKGEKSMDRGKDSLKNYSDNVGNWVC